MSALRNAMDFLGLAEPNAEELAEYGAQDETVEETPAAAPAMSSTAALASSSNRVSSSASRERLKVTQFPRPEVVANPAGDLRRIVTVTPSSYNEAKEIGDSFRSGSPVILNLSRMGDQEARRMVDFAAGLIFGLEGTIEKIDGRVFLLSPKSVEVETATASARKSHGLF